MKITHEELIDDAIIENLKELGEGDGGSFLKEIINLYLEQAPGLMTEVRQYASGGEAEKMGKSAHTLKGSSLNVGAKLFSDVCRKIEMAGKDNNLEGIDDMIGEMDEIYRLTEEELKSL